eukprot:TRINITY_DN47485_c0_g1_i1.p1 TRINITY_DN47485_c0_g1~~TRINITY_DN47485_c0_g1_i1.p1  ORF type:complete len:776 (-),score=288.95 TRINITY_DN47485_c0_g1_i1:311-2638(-)
MGGKASKKKDPDDEDDDGGYGGGEMFDDKPEPIADKLNPVKHLSESGVGHAMFIIDNDGDIEDFYHVESKRLGEGSFARVCKAHNRSTGAVRACKIICKSSKKAKNDLVWYEIAVMKMLDHPNICKMFENFEDRCYIYIIQEICEGGEVYEALISKGHFSEMEAAHVMNQLFRAVYYMHTSQIMHRDLKPENLMFSREGEIQESTLKVVDFGHARVFQAGTMLTTKCGAVYYISPQVLAGRYDAAADLWTLGVVLYCCIAGYPPFCGDNDAEILSKVRLGNFVFSQGDWKHITPECKELVRGLLKINPRDRTRAKEAMMHDWIEKFSSKKNVPMNLKIIDNIRKFRTMGTLKKAAIHLIASQIDDEITRPLREIFMSLDWSGDGLISASEIRVGLIKAGVKVVPEDLEELLMDIDTDGSGEIDYTEFLAATLDAKVYTKDEICWSAFRVFDRDGDGVVTCDELKNALNNGSVTEVADEDLVRDMIKDVDENGDGKIYFSEFCKMLKGTSQPYIYKSDKEKEREIRRRKKKEGVLQFEKATEDVKKARQAKKGTQKKTMMGALGEALAGRSKSKHQGGDGDRKSKMNKNLIEDILHEAEAGDGSYHNKVEEAEKKAQGLGGKRHSRASFKGKGMTSAQRKRASMRGSMDFIEEDDGKIYSLEVHVKSARMEDVSGMEFWVVVEVPGGGSANKFQTETVGDAQNPTWDHKESIPSLRSTDKLVFSIMEHAMSPAVGKVELTFDEIFPKGWHGEMKMKAKQGQVHIDVDVDIAEQEGN